MNVKIDLPSLSWDKTKGDRPTIKGDTKELWCKEVAVLDYFVPLYYTPLPSELCLFIVGGD